MSIKNTTIGRAVQILKNGGIMRRAAWPDLMWLVYIPGSIRPLAVDSPYGHAIRKSGAPQTVVEIMPHIDVHYGEGAMQAGWQPTQIDLLAEDWELVDDGSG